MTELLNLNEKIELHRQFRMLDCFCGMGGVSDGFAMEGFDVTGIDIVDAPKMLGYKHRFIQADMIMLKGEDFRGFDVIWGSPPCRDFTILNDARWKIKKNPENGLKLVRTFMQFVYEAEPKFWIMENVFGLEKYLPKGTLLPHRLLPNKISKAIIGGKRHIFYGNFPFFLLPESAKFKIRESRGWDKLAHWKRSKIPLACSRAFAVACREKLLDVEGKREEKTR